MAGWYELKKNDKGQFFFVLKAGNAEVILRSEQYESRAAAEGGIASVQKNAPADERFTWVFGFREGAQAFHSSCA